MGVLRIMGETALIIIINKSTVRLQLCPSPAGLLPISLLALSPRVQALQKQVKDFIEEHVIPLEAELMARQNSDDCWTPHPKIEEIKVQKGEGGARSSEQHSFIALVWVYAIPYALLLGIRSTDGLVFSFKKCAYFASRDSN